ncbi:MAG: sulfatase-like hydrolase/transferase [Bryobacterales bacterium]|nr:sulfatase-like hydrolase/transferase [Bryobacterales bacterium]
MRITRRAMVSGMAAGTALHLSAPAVLRGAVKPNILFLLTDQQTHHAMSCAGNPWVRTPAMDSIAASGTRFEAAYCPYPVCSPSRSSIFSGAMPHQTGVMVNGRAIRDGLPTLGEVFRQAGYETAYGGKWHLPKSFDGMTGFDKIIGGNAMGAKMDAPLAAASAEWLRGRAARKGDPFFMVASFMNPHDICEWIRQHEGRRPHPNLDRFPPAPRHLEIDPREPEAIQYHREQGYDLMSQAVRIASQWGPDEFRHYLHDYYRMVEDVDAQVGRVLAALRESGLAQNTIVAFCSDHGEGMGAHRWVQKAAFWEETVRVPLLLSGPGVPAGKRSRNLVSLEDLMPTFCGLAGLQAPATCVGQNLLAPKPRQFVVSELRYKEASREGRMLRTARYKFITHNSGARREMLFDLDKDPGENRNLAESAAHRKTLESHRALLKQWTRQTSDSFGDAV